MSTTTRWLEARCERTGACVGSRVRVADRMWTRLRGLLGYPELRVGEGLRIVPCNGVHTAGMRYAIDVVFLDRAGCVVRIEASMRPGRAVPWVRGAHEALELPAGAAVAAGLLVGDTLVWSEASRSTSQADGLAA